MTPVQLKALERYISAVAYFMLKRGGAAELIDARKHLEASFGATIPVSDFADIL